VESASVTELREFLVFARGKIDNLLTWGTPDAPMPFTIDGDPCREPTPEDAERIADALETETDPERRKVLAAAGLRVMDALAQAERSRESLAFR
jgi:hypothetical protein